MDLDPFETKLRNQRFRRVSPEWRQEIIAAAEAAAKRATTSEDLQPSSWSLFLTQFRLRFAALLWPAPKAWAALAVIWLGILVINHGLSSRQELTSQRDTLPASLSAWREQERLLTELLEPPSLPVANRPRPEPARPRSEGGSDFAAA